MPSSFSDAMNKSFSFQSFWYWGLFSGRLYYLRSLILKWIFLTGQQNWCPHHFLMPWTNLSVVKVSDTEAFFFWASLISQKLDFKVNLSKGSTKLMHSSFSDAMNKSFSFQCFWYWGLFLGVFNISEAWF